MTPSEVFNTRRSFVQVIESEFLSKHNVTLSIKRDDLIHEEVSGNKWRKLKFNLLKAIEEKRKGILTFGGAYSNHLIATAAACSLLGLKSVGYVRGDELNQESNETLRKCAEYGMSLIFVSREEYSLKSEKFYIENLAVEHSNYLIVPEGGANYYGIIGCQEILRDMPTETNDVFVAQGTSTTSAGILSALNPEINLHVVPALKGYDSLQEMQRLLRSVGFEADYIHEILENVTIHSDYHFGGYGKYTGELLSFIHDFYKTIGVKLDPVYTGKVMFGIFDQIKKGVLDDRNILFIHTGGVQGSASIERKAGIKLYD